MLQFALGENVWEPWGLVPLSFAQGPSSPGTDFPLWVGLCSVSLT